METPILYTKRGCPYCQAAKNYLDQHEVEYQEKEVRSDPAAMEKLQEISGQSKTPTLVWNGDVLANFGTEELEKFLADHPAK
ncbi:MAG: glutaredoxin family protein [Chthoniobacterales bacterium]